MQSSHATRRCSPQPMCQHPRLALIPPESASCLYHWLGKKDPENICRFQSARAGRTQWLITIRAELESGRFTPRRKLSVRWHAEKDRGCSACRSSQPPSSPRFRPFDVALSPVLNAGAGRRAGDALLQVKARVNSQTTNGRITRKRQPSWPSLYGTPRALYPASQPVGTPL
jgi:hypothetical protein